MFIKSLIMPPPLTAICVNSSPHWQRLALSAARVAHPIRKRALGVPSARVKFLLTRRAKKQPLFLEKGKLEKNIGFLEVKNIILCSNVRESYKVRVFDETCQIEENLLFLYFCSLCGPRVPTSPGFTPPLQKDENPPLLKKNQSPSPPTPHTHTHKQTKKLRPL